ncbi:MAG: hypothetical protein QOF16_230 [Actinomycetota bacterium]|nr:hypothetical protein [Actinomycetota bacterium]
MDRATAMPRRATRGKLLWGGVLGGGFAWAGQLVVGYGIEEIACSSGSAGSDIFGISVPTLIYVLSAAAAAATIAAMAVCMLAIRAARGSSNYRDERIVFMGITGLAANLLFLAIIGFVAIAPVYLGSCR